jgi:hypothetical protein
VASSKLLGVSENATKTADMVIQKWRNGWWTSGYNEDPHYYLPSCLPIHSTLNAMIPWYSNEIPRNPIPPIGETQPLCFYTLHPPCFLEAV